MPHIEQILIRYVYMKTMSNNKTKNKKIWGY